MLIKILLNYILGYLNIQVEGYFVERFINLCISKRILLWNSDRKKSILLITNISIKDFRKIKNISKQTRCRIKILKKKGLPFIFNKYRKRKIFGLLFVLFFAIIVFLSKFIWNIEIVGNDRISKEEILNNLEIDGLKVGVFRDKINVKELVDKLRLERNDLAWVGIELKGTNAIVKIVEADLKPEIIDEDEYCNLVATKSGIIVKVNAINGTPLVKEGDVVNKGSLLIGGYLEGKYTGTRYVHANGYIYAKVWYSDKEKVEYKSNKNIRTGNEESKYSVKINNFQINFYKTLSKFKKYDTIRTNNRIRLFNDFYLPIEIVKTVNYEQVEESISYTKEEAKEIAIQKAKNKIEEQIINREDILNTYINFTENEEGVEVEVIYEVLEEIGTKEKIVF